MRHRRWSSYLILSLLCLGGTLTTAHACTFQWDPVTTYMDGTPAAGIKYRLYFQAALTSVVQMVADTGEVSATLVCPAGSYWVTAYGATATESAKSEVVTLGQAAKPVNLKWTK